MLRPTRLTGVRSRLAGRGLDPLRADGTYFVGTRGSRRSSLFRSTDDDPIEQRDRQSARPRGLWWRQSLAGPGSTDLHGHIAGSSSVSVTYPLPYSYYVRLDFWAPNSQLVPRSMRIPIREQLGLLVLFTTLVALAVVAIATVRTPFALPCRGHLSLTGSSADGGDVRSGSTITASSSTSGPRASP